MPHSKNAVAQRTVLRDEVQDGSGGQVVRELDATVRTLAFTFEWATIGMV